MVEPSVFKVMFSEGGVPSAVPRYQMCGAASLLAGYLALLSPACVFFSYAESTLIVSVMRRVFATEFSIFSPPLLA